MYGNARKRGAFACLYSRSNCTPLLGQGPAQNGMVCPFYAQPFSEEARHRPQAQHGVILITKGVYVLTVARCIEDTREKSHDETHLETLFFSLGIEHHREDPVLYQPNLSMRPRVVTVLLANQRERAEEVFR